VTEGNAKVGVAVMVGEGVIVGVKVSVGITVSVGVRVNVWVAVGGCVAVDGIAVAVEAGAVGVTCCPVGREQAERNRKIRRKIRSIFILFLH